MCLSNDLLLFVLQQELWTGGFDLTSPQSKKQLYEYLERSCFLRQWSPGKTYIGFNMIKNYDTGGVAFGPFEAQSDHAKSFMFNNRQLVPYDEAFHSERAVYFPGHDKNRMLTHFYGYLFFADVNIHRYYLRLVRDRLRYLDSIFCTAGRVIDLIQRDSLALMKDTSGKDEYVDLQNRFGD